MVLLPTLVHEELHRGARQAFFPIRRSRVHTPHLADDTVGRIQPDNGREL